MSNREKLLDDLARFAGGTVELLSGATNQARDGVKSRLDELAQALDLVPREDFERLEAMVTKLRSEQEALKNEIATLQRKKPANKKTESKPKVKTAKTKKGK